jgi:prolyl-tRNA editing enzyme YbaK/EbsC (Cys-tRNA(Pro) deacylase)
MNSAFNKLLQLLNDNHIRYELTEHAPTYTSNESALARGESLHVGAKALLIKGDESFYLFVMSAVLKLDSKKTRNVIRGKKIRFATKEELFDLTGLVPGSVPPYGEPVLPFKLIIDTSITKLSYIAFNAGSLEASIKMDVRDYLNSSNGTLADVTMDLNEN